MFNHDQDLSMESLKQLRIKNKNEVNDLYNVTDLAIQYEFIGGIFQSTKNFLSKSIAGIGNWFAELKNSTPDPLPHFVKIDKDVAVVHKFCQKEDNYLNYGSETIPYMLGCDLNYKELGNKLTTIKRNHVEIIHGLLDEVDTFISKVVSSGDFRNSNAPIRVGPDTQEGIRFTETIDKLHSSVIKANEHVDRRPLNTICNNLKELDDCSTHIDVLKKAIEFKSMGELLKRVEAISVKANALSKDIENGEIKCTKAIVDGIKLYLGHGANAVTALSTYYYLVSQYALIYKAIAREVSSF